MPYRRKGSRRRPLVKCTPEHFRAEYDRIFGKPVPGFPGWRWKDEGSVPDFSKKGELGPLAIERTPPAGLFDKAGGSR